MKLSMLDLGVTMFVSIHRVSARFSSTDSGCHNLTLEEVRAIQVRFAFKSVESIVNSIHD